MATGVAGSRDFDARPPLHRNVALTVSPEGGRSVGRRAWGNSCNALSRASLSLILAVIILSGGESWARTLSHSLPWQTPEPPFVDLSDPHQTATGLAGTEPVSALLADSPTPESRLYEAIMSRIGLPYRLGGIDDLGYDCSGFIWRVFQEAGIDIPRNSVRELWERLPEANEGEEGTFGVIVFFNGLTHAGIVRDAHSFYHASSSQGIVRSFFSDYWGARVTGYRRVPLSRPSATRPRWSRPRRAVTNQARPSSPRRSMDRERP